MQEAVGRCVPDDASVCMGTALEALIPFTAGGVRCVQAAWAGNALAVAPYLPTRSLLGTGLLDSNPTHNKRNARARLDRWVYCGADWKGFLSTLGAEAREAARVKTPRLSEPLDYGA